MFRPLLVSIEIARPHNMLVAAFGALAGFFIAGGRDFSLVLAAAVFTGVVTGAGNVINDFFDAPIDRVNKPRRPIPSQRIAPRTALAIYLVATTLTVPAALVLLPLDVFLLTVAWMVGLFVYARWAKRVFVVGNLVVAAIASSAFLAGAMVAGRAAAAVVPIAIAFLFVLSRELVKGAEDIEGDRRSGVSTVAVVVGLEKTLLAASVLMLGLTALIPLPTMIQYYGRPYLWVMELAVVPGLVWSAYLVLVRPGRRVFNRVSWILKVEMLFGILAVGLGKL